MSDDRDFHSRPLVVSRIHYEQDTNPARAGETFR